MLFYIVVSLSAFILSLLGTRLMILALRDKRFLLDRPNARSNHKAPIPRGGGIAVVFTILIFVLVVEPRYELLLAMLMLAAVSLLDDWITISPLVRLMVQILAVGLMLSLMPSGMIGSPVPVWIDMLLTGLFWLWMINLFNFMDGIDGISAAEMISIGAGLCLLVAFLGTFPSTLALYALILMSAGCGFLWWNWHPARIFLGDAGSIPIGFFIGYLLILGMQQGSGYAALILPAYYLSDSTITLLRRVWRNQKPWEAHSEHYYQRAVRKGWRHDRVVSYIMGVNILLIMLAIFATLFPAIALINLVTAYAIVFMVLGFFAYAPHDTPYSGSA